MRFFGFSGFRTGVSLAACLSLFPVSASVADYANAKNKVEMVIEDRAPRGTLITLSKAELNAYLQKEVPAVAPDAIRNPRVELSEDRATGTLLIDILKLRQSRGVKDGWVMSKLLAGERPMKVTVRIRSWSGQGRVDIEKVEVSGVPLSGPPLDFLLRHYVQPHLPNVKLGQDFPLAHNLERFDVRPDAIRMQVRK